MHAFAATARPRFPWGAGRAPRTVSYRGSEAQDDYQVGTGTRAIVGPRRLSGLEGFFIVGHPTKRWELYSNHSEAVVTGITGRFSATYFSIGTRSAVCLAVVAAPASLARSASISVACNLLVVAQADFVSSASVKPAVVHVVRRQPVVLLVLAQLEVAISKVVAPGAHSEALEVRIDAGRPQLASDDRADLGVVGVRGRADQGDRNGPSAPLEPAVLADLEPGRLQDVSGRRRSGRCRVP